MPHNVASDLDLHCLPMTYYGFPGKNGLKRSLHFGRAMLPMAPTESHGRFLLLKKRQKYLLQGGVHTFSC